MLITLNGYTVGELLQDFFVEEFEHTIGELRTGDAPWPIGHGARPGADFLDAASITLTLCTSPLITNEAAAQAALNRLATAWRSSLGARPGVLVPLEFVIEGRARVVYGRPGRFSPPPPGSRLMRQGAAHVLAEFRVLDPHVYDVESTGLSLSVVPRSLGGIIAPITTPVTTSMTSGVEYRMLTVPGDAPAPLRVTFHGPARDPRLAVDGAEIVGVVGSLAYDEDITVDGRTRTVALADGTPAGHPLSRSSRLDLLRVEPGVHELAFSATDRTGTAEVTVEATPTFYHL